MASTGSSMKGNNKLLEELKSVQETALENLKKLEDLFNIYTVNVGIKEHLGNIDDTLPEIKGLQETAHESTTDILSKLASVITLVNGINTVSSESRNFLSALNTNSADIKTVQAEMKAAMTDIYNKMDNISFNAENITLDQTDVITQMTTLYNLVNQSTNDYLSKCSNYLSSIKSTVNNIYSEIIKNRRYMPYIDFAGSIPADFEPFNRGYVLINYYENSSRIVGGKVTYLTKLVVDNVTYFDTENGDSGMSFPPDTKIYFNSLIEITGNENTLITVFREV